MNARILIVKLDAEYSVNVLVGLLSEGLQRGGDTRACELAQKERRPLTIVCLWLLGCTDWNSETRRPCLMSKFSIRFSFMESLSRRVFAPPRWDREWKLSVGRMAWEAGVASSFCPYLRRAKQKSPGLSSAPSKHLQGATCVGGVSLGREARQVEFALKRVARRAYCHLAGGHAHAAPRPTAVALDAVRTRIRYVLL